MLSTLNSAFAFQNDFQIALQNEGMIEDVVKYLSNENDDIKKHCAVIIYEVRPLFQFGLSN